MQEQEKYLRLTLWASLFFLLVNHLTQPKAFAATQLLFDYHDGIARRGLGGAVLNFFALPEISASEIRLALVLITLAGTIAVLGFLYRSYGAGRAGMLLLIVLVNSYAFSSFVGNVGYLDGVLVALAVAALASNAASPFGLALRVAAMLLGVLTHENMLPYFGVLITFDLWLSGRRASAFMPLAAGVLMVAGLAVFTGRGADEALIYADWLQSKATFGVDPEATIVAGRGLAANFALMADLRGTSQYKAWLLFDGLPLLGLALWLIWLNLTLLGQGEQGAARVTKVLMVLAVLAPVSLNIIAFDVVRFGVASVLCGAMVAALILRRQDGARERMESALTWPRVLLVLVLVSNMFTTQVNTSVGHLDQFPWILLEHLNWSR